MKKLLTICAVLALQACASSTSYMAADGPNDYGYSDSQLTENRYRVSFRGNTSTSSDEVKDMALLRAAELTMLNGQDWFRIANQETQETTRSTPETSTRVGTGTQVYRDCGLLGCTTTVAPGYSGVEVVTTRKSNRFSSSIEIVMGEGEVEDQTAVYNASELYAYLNDRY